jgi:serine protease inhibitor
MTALTDRLRNWLGTSPSPTSGLAFNAVPHVASPSRVSNHNAWALDLYQRLHAGSNLVFSPFSIRLALSMTRAGAVGETAAQMDAALRLTPWDSAES